MAKNIQTAAVTESADATSGKTLPYPKDGSQASVAIQKYGNVSKAIRGLHGEGFTRGEVSKMLGKRYQHVRNVLITPVKKAG